MKLGLNGLALFKSLCSVFVPAAEEKSVGLALSGPVAGKAFDGVTLANGDKILPISAVLVQVFLLALGMCTA
jgi:hypothetical protein